MTSTFAPPTGPPLPTSPPGPEMVPVPADAPIPGRRRRPLLLAAAVAVVVALAVGAFVALGGARTGSDDVAEPYSLIAAAQSTASARSVEFDVTVTAGDLATMSVSGAVDNESELVSVTADLSSLLAQGDTPMPFGGGEMNVLLDAAAGVLYLDASSLAGFLPTDSAWVSIDLAALAEQTGQSLDDLSGELTLDPSDVARSLLDTDTAVDLGVETIDGVETKHYQVSVDLAAALASIPQTELEMPVDMSLDDLGVPDTIVYDVWVSADNQLRRVAFDAEIAGQSVGMRLDLTATDEALGIELPDEGDIFDLTALLGF